MRIETHLKNMKTSKFVALVAITLATFVLTSTSWADSPSKLGNNPSVKLLRTDAGAYSSNRVSYRIRLIGGEGPQTVKIIGKLVPYFKPRVVRTPNGLLGLATEEVKGAGKAGRYLKSEYRFPGPGTYKVVLRLKKNWRSNFYITNKSDDGQRGPVRIGPVTAVWDGELHPGKTH